MNIVMENTVTAESSHKKKKQRTDDRSYNVVSTPDTAGKLTLKISKSNKPQEKRGKFSMCQIMT